MGSLKDEIKKFNKGVIRKQVTAKAIATTHTLTEQRIFAKGKAATGQNIGIYSKEYMKTRRRKHYPNPGSKKVTLQATNQMVNDYRFGVDANNNFVSGFANQFNFKKSHWVEKTYKKEIFALSDQEEKKLGEFIDKLLRKWIL